MVDMTAELATGSIAQVNDTVGGSVDGKYYQSVSVQVSGTFVGTLSFQTSNNGVTWFSKALIPSNGALPQATTTGTILVSGDMGGRYFRVVGTAMTSGTADVTILFNSESQSQAATPSQGTQTITGTVNANMFPVVGATLASTTNLGAGALYTSTTVDNGTVVTAYPTRIRPVVRHVAGIAFATLILEESTDGTNFIETRRSPIPSDGLYHTFDWPLHYRYYRMKLQNGATAQTAMHVGWQSSRGDGSSIDTRNVTTFDTVNGALTAAQTANSANIDLGGNHDFAFVRVFAVSNQTGAVGVNWSHDGTNWFAQTSAEASTPVTAGAIGAIVESKVVARYCRVSFVNGATASTATRVAATIVSL